MSRSRTILPALIALVLFTFLTIHVLSSGEITRIDREVSSRLEADGISAPAAVTLFQVLTFLGSASFLVPLTLAVVAVMLWRGQPILALAFAVASAGGSVLNFVIKELVRRPRPEFAAPLVHETSWSYPSGHSMGSLVVYGMLAYVLCAAFSLGRGKIAVWTGVGLLVLGIGCSRPYLGAHWPSDVAAGFTAGAVWLIGCIGATEQARRRFQAKTV